VPRPSTGLRVRPLDPGLGWCDDPADPLYNRAVRLPRGGRHEGMWRDDHLYDYVVVLGYNDRPPLRPFGSAIFLHLARDGYQPTEGCVAISLGAMRRLLPRLGPTSRLTVSSA
jgi:L,D-peptidoglycan transpeptidase YkuD (ErfK/YbiS/YcfS/YnhG family)